MVMSIARGARYTHSLVVGLRQVFAKEKPLRIRARVSCEVALKAGEFIEMVPCTQCHIEPSAQAGVSNFGDHGLEIARRSADDRR